ncbi:MAG: N-acetyl-gamma-glutamyl-phosphate reductase [Candidatus Schekmanbacteria bacterium]|nr:N-acetyl-gamma-glutamyl-phosphate reductase [Candidatus Schekmanbacteria bacterium]
MAIKIGILGAASYVAGELIKILLLHPQTEITYLESETFAGQNITLAHSFLRGLCNLSCEKYNKDAVLSRCELLFICKSHGESMGYVVDLQDSNLRIVDLSADFRLKDAQIYQKWYGKNHLLPQALAHAVYGLAEINSGQIKQTSLIANPGCYPTSVILACAPLIQAGVVNSQAIAVNAFSGLSGAGKTPKAGFNLFIDAFANIKPYRAGAHAHQPEIEQELQNFSQQKVQVSFIPHIVPIERGIISNIVLNANRTLSNEQIAEIYQEFYAGQPFIQIYHPPQMPQISDVAGTNFCALGWYYDQRTNLLTVISMLDNVLKGAAGQAVQCMNIMYDFPQTLGLPWGKLL